MVEGRRSIALLLVVLVLAVASPRAEAGSAAEQLLWQGKVDAALFAAREEARARPDDLDAHELYIDILLSAGLAPRAEREYGERVRQAPTDPDAHYLLGRAVRSAEAARASYEKALRFQPDHARSHMGMAAVHVAAGRAAEARDAYARAVELDPSLSEAWLGLVRGQVATGRAEDAAGSAKEALKHVPDEGGLYLALALLEPANARDILAKGSQRAPQDPRVQEALAGRLLSDGDAAAALAAADRALALDPRLQEAGRTRLFARALVAGSLDRRGYDRLLAARDAQDAGDRAAAAAAYDALVQEYAGTPLTWLARAQHRQTHGDRDGALSDLARALKVDASYTEAQAAYGMLLLDLGRPEEARTWLGKASGARPWDVSLGLALGRAHLEAKDPVSAVMELEALRQRSPWNIDTVLLLAQAHVDSGEPDKGYRVVKELLDYLPEPRLAVALVLTATAAGRYGEAASLLEELAARSGSDKLREMAARLRAQEQGG